MIAAHRPAAPATRGYAPLYHGAAPCPACGGTHWHVGRHSAECARCGTALPLSPERRGN
ncbi:MULTISPECIES: hypothetical protein [unclassified Sphingomonas]|uniref:hypothetical protein n=1 Tax=unclassified Sphingomonas TaxID=196159 RepID=UPI000AFFFD0E|nr:MULTISPECIES: hypothetical protein [unclassified Sphingomonas]